MSNTQITTIKLKKRTKERLGNLKIHHRETYEEILQRILNILNLARLSPEKAQRKLLLLERQIKIKKLVS